MARRKTTMRSARGPQPEDRVETEVEEDAGGGAAAGTAQQSAGAAAAGGVTQSIADAINQMRQSMNNITESVGKVIEQKVDVGEGEAQGAGLVQGTDAARGLHDLIAHNAATLSNHVNNETARYASAFQATTAVAMAAMQTLQTLVAATAANDETQQRATNCDVRMGRRAKG